MGRKSISNALAGGLITGATVMGMEALVQPVQAAPMVSTQFTDVNFDFSNNALTCCYDINGSQHFVFDGFDPALGELNTADLGLTLTGLAFDNALTCCYDINSVRSFSGSFGGVDLTEALVRDLADGMATVQLDINNIGVDLNTVTFDFNLLFGDGSVFPTGNTTGVIAYSYTYEPAAVPAPGTGMLVLPWLVGLLAADRIGRRRRED